MLVFHAGGYYGRPLTAYRGVTQGGPFSPRIFNVMANAIVREWLHQMFSEEAARHGYVIKVRTLLAIFYADDAMLALRNPVQLHEALDINIGLFEHVRLRTITTNMKVMTCVLEKIRTCHSHHVYNNSQEGMVAADEWKHRLVDCDICGQSLQAASLPSHLEMEHDMYRSKVIEQDLLIEWEALVYEAHQPIDAALPGPRMCGFGATIKWNLCRHFCLQHPLDFVYIIGEGCYPKCRRCGIQVSPLVSNHEGTKSYQEGYKCRVQHEAAVDTVQALGHEFQAYGETLERGRCLNTWNVC